ncbi:hypothetical protein [Paraburkholderia xenovorans]|uniref:hypothetical protein n=1 Tax=Paraburkholderia xenovorans TaxID=36873 RepID=UPI0038B6E72C
MGADPVIRHGLTRLPDDAGLRQFVEVPHCAVGFTWSLFVALLAVDGHGYRVPLRFGATLSGVTGYPSLPVRVE